MIKVGNAPPLFTVERLLVLEVLLCDVSVLGSVRR